MVDYKNLKSRFLLEAAFLLLCRGNSVFAFMQE